MSKDHEVNQISDLSKFEKKLKRLSTAIHENSFKGEAKKRKKTRASLVLFTQDDEKYAKKIGIIDKLSTDMGDKSFDVPEELIIDILSRVPLKTLFRFKCVSNKWKLLISNSIPMTNSPKLLICARSENQRFSFHSMGNETRVERMSTPMDEHLLNNHKVVAHSSCQGLILVQIDDDLFLWNPLTSFIRKVLTYKGLAYMRANDSDCSFFMDLCYCSANDEYKVVLVQKSWSISWDTQEFYVATCGDNDWKELDICLANMSPGPFFQGYRHWIRRYDSLGSNSDKDSDSDGDLIPSWKRIMYFDPSTNEFIDVPMPQPKKSDSDTFLSLGVYDGCLCITRWDDPRNYKGNIELLVMKEYGIENSWEVMFVFSNTPEFRCYGDLEPLFKTKKGEILVRMDMGFGACSVKACDVHGNFLRDIFSLTLDECFEHDSDALKVISYEENWFLPADRE